MKINQSIHALHPSRGSLVYTVYTDAGLVLVDCGSHPGGAAEIMDYITCRLHEKETRLQYVFLTHWHCDHVGAAEEIRDRTGARIVCPKMDASYLGGESSVDFFMGMPMPRNGLNPIFKGVCVAGYRFMQANTKPLRPDLLVEEGDSPFGPDWSILNLPGHTPGSSGLWSPDQKVLFAGDTVIAWGKRLIRVLPFLIDNEDDIEQSLDRIYQLGQINWLLPGHFNPVRLNRALMVR